MRNSKEDKRFKTFLYFIIFFQAEIIDNFNYIFSGGERIKHHKSIDNQKIITNIHITNIHIY